MKIGQTSIIVFLAQLLASAIGFLSTLYFARVLGAEVIGLYALVMTVVGWLILAGKLGIGKATVKRISEGHEQGAYLSAAVIWVMTLATVFSIGIILLSPALESYFDEFGQYISISVVWFLVAILFTKLFFHIVFHLLNGEQQVHIAGVLDTVKTGGLSLLQIGLVAMGYSLLGMLVGYIIGGLIVGLLGLYWVATRPSVPNITHFKSLFNYAKYSWLGGLKSRAFNDVDILILGIFVSPALIGVYSVSWSIAKFLDLFGSAVSSAMFPEISRMSTQESKQAVAGLIEDSLAYTGLIAMPGLMGGIVLGEQLLQIYGTEFVQGTAVLGLLIFAVLLYSYQKQLLNTLNGIDRPDLSFRINVVFISLNIILNILLIRSFGIEGAAIATAVSAAAGTILSYIVVKRVLDFRVPVGELTCQLIATLLMGTFVWTARDVIETSGIVQHNIVIVLLLVSGGATVYFLTLFGISSHFRGTVKRNIPFGLFHQN